METSETCLGMQAGGCQSDDPYIPTLCTHAFDNILLKCGEGEEERGGRRGGRGWAMSKAR